MAFDSTRLEQLGDILTFFLKFWGYYFRAQLLFPIDISRVRRLGSHRRNRKWKSVIVDGVWECSARTTSGMLYSRFRLLIFLWVLRVCWQNFSFYCNLTFVKALRYGTSWREISSHSFICHILVYPQVEWATPQPQSVIALWLVLISRPAEGRRLSWPGLLGEILKWVFRPKTVTHPSRSSSSSSSKIL